MPAYLFPFCASEQSTDDQAPDTAVYRAFWSIFLLVGVVTVMIGGFVIICASPLASHRLYKVGGALLLTGGELSVVFLCSDIADACQILQCLDRYFYISANHTLCYRNLVPEGIVNNVVRNHCLIRAGEHDHHEILAMVGSTQLYMKLKVKFGPVAILPSLLHELHYNSDKRCPHRVPT